MFCLRNRTWTVENGTRTVKATDPLQLKAHNIFFFFFAALILKPRCAESEMWLQFILSFFWFVSLMLDFLLLNVCGASWTFVLALLCLWFHAGIAFWSSWSSFPNVFMLLFTFRHVHSESALTASHMWSGREIYAGCPTWHNPAFYLGLGPGQGDPYLDPLVAT